MAGVKFTIGADSQQAVKELASFQKKSTKFAARIAKGFKERVGQRIFDGLISAASQLPSIASSAIDQASALNEEIGKSQAVFGGSAKNIEKWSKGTAESLGISKVAALEATGTMGNMLRAFGISGNEAANMSQSLVMLAADMGSFNNASIEDSIFAIGAALRGETEPIRRFGVSLDDATLKAEALRMGIYSGKGPLDAQAKAMASYQAILRQTSIQQGNFAETSDDIANSNKILKAKLSDLTATIGESLLPATQQFIDLLKNTDFEAIGNKIGKVAENASHFFNVILTNGDSTTPIFDEKKVLNAKVLAKQDISDENLSMFDEDFKKEIEKEKVNNQNADFRQKLKQEEVLQNKIKDTRLEEEKRTATVTSLKDEYANTLKILDARIRGDKKLLEQEEIRKEMMEEAKRTAVDGVAISEKSARMIVMKRREADEAEAKREKQKENETNKKQKEKGDIEDQIKKTESSLNSAMSRSSISAVSSMQAIGGGGGASGVLNLQKTQTDLQRQLVDLQQKMVGILEGVKTGVDQEPVSQH